MPNGNDKPKNRLGDIPQETYLKSPREIAAESSDSSSSLIGGKGSSALGSFIGNVASGFSSVAAAPFKAIDRSLASAAGVEYREDVASPLTKLGSGIESAVETVAAPDPERTDQFVSKLGSGLGSTLGFLLPGALAGKTLSGAAGMAGLGAAATGVEQAEDYERARTEAGLPIEKSDQAASFFYGLLPGTLEAVPLARMLGRYDDIVKGGLTAAVKNTGKGTLEEALQEGIQSTASNLIASDLVKYDKDRDMFFDTPEAAAVGGGVGFLLNSVMSAVGLRQRGKYHEEAMKVQQDQNKIASEQEETQSKINPATGEQLDNAEIAKTNKLINRYTRLSETDQVNAQAYDKRIEELKKELKEKYFTQDENGKFTSSAADRQEAQDVLTRIGVEEVEQIEAAPAPFKGDVGVAEAEPFPDRMGKSYQVSKITNKKSIEKFNEDLARYRPEEITITGVNEPLPGTEGIDVEEIQPEVEEINLDTTPAPQERTFFDDKPANTAMAEQLQRITEQRKRRDETDAAFEARKEAEINEAYRQRELQLAEQEPNFETQEEAVQPTTPEPIDTPQTEQTKEEVSSPPQGSVVTKSGKGYKSEAIAKAQMKNKKIDGEVVEYAPDQFAIIPKEAQDALRRQAGFGETLPEQVESTPQDGTPKFLSDREGIPTPNGIEAVTEPVVETTQEPITEDETDEVQDTEVVTGDDLVSFPVEEEATTTPNQNPFTDKSVKDVASIVDAVVAANNPDQKIDARVALKDHIAQADPSTAKELLKELKKLSPAARVKEITDAIQDKIDNRPAVNTPTMRGGKVVEEVREEVSAPTKINPETQTPEGVTPGTIGDLWTATHSEHKHRIEIVQGDRYYRTIQDMTEEQVAEYRDYDSAGRRNYIERLHKERLEPLLTKMSKAGVKKIKQFMSDAKIEGRSKATTKGQMLNLILEEMDGRTEALATGYFSTDKATISKEANNIVDDDAGYESAGKDLSEGTVEQIVNSPVEKPEQIPLDPEVYDEVIRIGNAMRESENPERFIDEIAEKFETVRQFTTMYASIESGMVVRGEENTTEVIATPVGTVETVEEVIENQSEPIPLPEEVVETSLDEIESRLDTLDIEIQDLQEQLEDPYLEREDKSELKKQLARKEREIKELEAQQQGVFAEKKRISEEEIQEVKALDKESENPEAYEDDDPSASYTVETLEREEIAIFGTPKVRTKEEDYAHRAISRFRSQMDPTFKDMVEFYVVTREEDIPAKYASIRHDYKENWENSGASGLYYEPRAGRSKHLVVLLPRPGMSRSRVEKTLYHETIGHFGMKKVFGAEWDGFLDMLLKNPDLAAKAYSLRGRWPHLDELVNDTYGLSPENVIQFKEKYTHTASGLTYFTTQFEKTNGPMRRVSKPVMRKLMDEYLAEISGDMSRESYREVTKQDRSLMKRIGTWIRHLLRKAGIQIPITNSDVLSFVGESYERILGGGVAVFQGKIGLDIDQSRKYLKRGMKVDTLVDMNSKAAVNRVKTANNDLIKSRMFVISNGGTPSASMVPSDELNEAHAAMDEAINVNIDLGFTASREEALKTLKSIDAREGRLDNSNHQRRVERVSDWIRRTKLGKVLSSNGHLPFVRVLNAIEAKGKGGIEQGQVFARKFARLTKDLNDIQKKAMYDYFKTRDADITNLPVDEEVKKVLSQAKDYIERYGESLVIQGKLRRETWEASKGSYLPIRYWRYMEGYYASGGKRMSLQNYLKQQKGLSEEEKAALGEVKDVSFLVPETIATISRDVALNGMFKNIITFDEVGKLGWTLGERQYTDVNGKKMKLSDIEKKIESLEFLRDVDQDIAPTFKTQSGHDEILRQLEQYYEGRDTAKAALREEIREVLTERGITDITEDMINQIRDREYIQVNDKRYGALHKKFIRKELYDEIVESGQMLDKEHADFFGKAFGAGGYADRANQRWKSLKVTLNPPSWFRNGIGNLVLMDIGTNTSINRLVGMLVSEANSWRQGKPSKYFDIAHENGLWATTYSAAELNLMAREFKDAFKSEIRIDSSRNFMKKAWWMFDEKLQQIFEKGTEIYGGMEGFFKTVALRDYIERWEKQNNTSLDNADQTTREAVIREAVEAANNNIFDYSKVPGWMRTMRRMPFIGAPFLTYTFKAFPYVMESFARRPQKFIKYAMLPYVMAQAFMMNQDLDDDDYDQIRRMMPDWQKEKSSIYLLPWKDSNGNFQTIDFGYYMPWAPFHNIGMMATKTFDVNNPILSTGNAIFNLGTDLGFVGGPIPQMTSALITNKDPFTGREIIRTAGTTMDKQNDFMRYMVDMWTPTFLTSKGVLGRSLDNLGIEPTAFNTGQQLNALGKDKETWAQTALRGAGVSVRPLDPQLGIRSKVKAHQAEKRKLETARRAIFKDRNLSPESKAMKIREMNEQIKLLNKKYREGMFGE